MPPPFPTLAQWPDGLTVPTVHRAEKQPARLPFAPYPQTSQTEKTRPAQILVELVPQWPDVICPYGRLRCGLLPCLWNIWAVLGVAEAPPIFIRFGWKLGVMRATIEVHVPCAIFGRKSPPQTRGCWVFMKRASPRQHRTCAASVDSALGPGPTTPIKADSGPGRGIPRGRHKFPR